MRHFFALVYGGEAKNIAYFASLTPALERLEVLPHGSAYVMEYTLILAPDQRFIASPWRWIVEENGLRRLDEN